MLDKRREPSDTARAVRAITRRMKARRIIPGFRLFDGARLVIEVSRAGPDPVRDSGSHPAVCAGTTRIGRAIDIETKGANNDVQCELYSLIAQWLPEYSVDAVIDRFRRVLLIWEPEPGRTPTRTGYPVEVRP